MSDTSIEQLKQAIDGANLEIYRVEGDVILMAERVRMHLMESGVTVHTRTPPVITVRVRAQRSDFPTASDEALYQKVRDAIEAEAQQHGFEESGVEAREIRNPTNADDLLDVWYEVSYAKASSVSALVDDLRWALGRPRAVGAQG